MKNNSLCKILSKIFGKQPRNIMEDFAKITHYNHYQRTLNLIKMFGFDSVRVNYSGGGDSGSVDSIIWNPNKNATKNLDELSQLENNLEAEIEETISQPIWDHHGSFADGGGYSVDGCAVWDAVSGTVSIEGCDHWYDYDPETDETVDESDNEWTEDLYEYVPEEDLSNSQISEDSFEYVTFYCESFLNEPLPTDLHNLMLSEGLKGNVHAAKYAQWCEDIKGE